MTPCWRLFEYVSLYYMPRCWILLLRSPHATKKVGILFSSFSLFFLYIIFHVAQPHFHCYYETLSIYFTAADTCSTYRSSITIFSLLGLRRIAHTCHCTTRWAAPSLLRCFSPYFITIYVMILVLESRQQFTASPVHARRCYLRFSMASFLHDMFR
jgi:hypothetical protein